MFSRKHDRQVLGADRVTLAQESPTMTTTNAAHRVRVAIEDSIRGGIAVELVARLDTTEWVALAAELDRAASAYAGPDSWRTYSGMDEDGDRWEVVLVDGARWEDAIQFHGARFERLRRGEHEPSD